MAISQLSRPARKGLTDNWPKGGKGSVSQKDERYDGRAVLVRHELSQGDIEGQLNSLAEAVNSAADDERVDTGSSGADDNAQKGNEVAANKEPSPAEKIRQTADNGVGKGQGQSTGDVDPGYVGTRA